MKSNLGNLANVLSSVIEEVVDYRMKDNFKNIENPQSFSDILNSLSLINKELENQKEIINSLLEKLNKKTFLQRLFSYFNSNK
jgi:hypothetical protein